VIIDTRPALFDPFAIVADLAKLKIRSANDAFIFLARP
jgi:hypothetical protein